MHVQGRKRSIACEFIGRLVAVAVTLCTTREASGRDRRTVALGDSITAGYKVSVPYPSQLSSQLGEPVYNEGRGGRTSADGWRRIDEVITTYNPTHVLILYGANDINQSDNLRTSARRIGETAALARSRNVVPIVGTLTPFVSPQDSAKSSASRTLSRYLREGSSQYDYFVADVEAAFDSRSDLMQDDGLHPNDAGAQVIAETFRAVLSPLRPLPLAPTLVAPSGVVDTRRPLFRWNPAEEATWYQVRFFHAGTAYHSAWVQGSTQWAALLDFPWFAFQWDVRTWNPSGYGLISGRGAFNYVGPDAGVAGKITGLAAEYLGGGAVRYSWQGDYLATDYALWIGHEDGTSYRKVPVAAGRTTGRVVQTLSNHAMGGFKWWVQGTSLDGVGTWSDAAHFVHGQPVPLAPSGLQSGSPTQGVWNDVDSDQSTWYELRLRRNGLAYWSSWVKREETTQPAAGERAFALPGTLYFPQGHYEFELRGWSPLGYGPWSSSLGFDIPQRLPGTTAGLAPAGVLRETRRPRFEWQAAANAQWYYLHVARTGAVWRTQWVAAPATTWTAGEDLPLGTYDWWVRAWSADGYGPWAAKQSFELRGNLPDASTPLAPVGRIEGVARPAFSWTADPHATWYRLRVNRGGVAAVDRWFQGSTTWTPATDLPAGAYRWWVQTWSPDGYGPWSTALEFELVPSP